MVERVVPAGIVAVASARVELETELAAAEAAVVERAVAARRREFMTGRACARAALARLGLPPVPVPPGPAGEPRWPSGVVGSITHCEGYRAAAVARAGDLEALAIDAEPNRRLPAGVLAAVAADDERAGLRQPFEREPTVSWDRLLFSAKESVFKLWFPLTGERLGFDDARIRFDPAAGVFDVGLGPGRPGLQGRWVVGGGLVVTGICLSTERSLQSAAVTNRVGAWNGS